MNIRIYLLFFFFIILHELMHLIVACMLKKYPKKIWITPFGMKMELKENDKNLKAKAKYVQNILIYLSGPILNFVISVIGYNIVLKNGNVNIIFFTAIEMIYTNFTLGIFNLVPIYPLDGGRILKEIMKLIFGIKRAYKYSYIITKYSVILSTLISSFVIIYINNISVIFIVCFLWYLLFKERKRIKRIEYLKGLK